MKRTLVLAAGLILVASSAWSQSRDTDSRRDWPDRRDDWDRRDRMMHDRDDDGPGSGARFFVRSGDTMLRVVCGERESTRACVDAALMMFDRVQSHQSTRPSPPPTTPPSSQ